MHLARLAQSVERTPFKRVVVGSSPTSGVGVRIGLGLWLGRGAAGKIPKKGNGETIPQNKRCLTVLSVIRGVNTAYNLCLRGAYDTGVGFL